MHVRFVYIACIMQDRMIPSPRPDQILFAHILNISIISRIWNDMFESHTSFAKPDTAFLIKFSHTPMVISVTSVTHLSHQRASRQCILCSSAPCLLLSSSQSPPQSDGKMPALKSIFVKAYWSLAGIGIFWAVCILSLTIPIIQRK